jgi:hypothetical protein
MNRVNFSFNKKSIKKKFEKQDKTGVSKPECVTVWTVCTSRRIRARGRVTVQMSDLEQQSFINYILQLTQPYYQGLTFVRPDFVVRWIGMTQVVEWLR